MFNMNESSVENNLQMRLLMFPDMHPKEFQCPVCAKYFSRKFTLDAHMLIHKGEKPHSCQFCGKCFRQKGTLMRHKALHSSKNLFHCSLCNQGFRQKNVFIFHLRHRHNVSTETLDRRKYRTEPKDYQSIMDTLPPFVHADSDAISSSGKHFDAILCESIQKPVSNSETLQYSSTVENNMQDVHSSSISLNAESVSQENHMSITFSDHDNLRSKVFVASDYKNAHKSSFLDVKSFLNNNFNEVDSTELSPRNSNVFVSDAANPASSQLSNVTSSDDLNYENITCIPCQLNFNSEIEFKYHMKTHVQSVLLSDVNTDNAQNISDVQCKGSSDGLSVSTLLPIEKSFSNPISIPDSFNNKIKFPVKTEVLDSEIDPCLSQCTSNVQVPQRSLFLSKNKPNRKLKCPICKLFLDGDSAFRNHSKIHDSYSLLKLIYESFENKDISFNFQNCASHVSTACSENCSFQHLIKNNKFLQNVHNIDAHCSKSLVQTENLSNKNKSAFKIFTCVQCDEKFPNKFLFEYHRQLHLSTKGFFCKCCRKSFSSKKLLLSHTRLHHMKAFTCSKCFRIFSYRRLFDSHQKQCVKSTDTKTSNGSCINFPVVSIESLLKSDTNGIVGVIPVCTGPGEENKLKVGIPVMSVSHIKALYML